MYVSYSERVLQTLVNAARMDTQGFRAKYFYNQGDTYACSVQSASNPLRYYDRLQQGAKQQCWLMSQPNCVFYHCKPFSICVPLVGTLVFVSVHLLSVHIA